MDNLLVVVVSHIPGRQVKVCAELLEDTELLAKLSVGDMVAIEAKYHTKCWGYIIVQGKWRPKDSRTQWHQVKRK